MCPMLGVVSRFVNYAVPALYIGRALAKAIAAKAASGPTVEMAIVNQHYFDLVS